MRDSAGPPNSQRIPVFSRTDYLLALFSALLAFALYLRTLAPGLLGGDSGELQFAAWLGGAAHPTGYPLYLMLGWLWAHLLPLHDPAWRMNAFSALWGGVAVGLTYLLAVRMLKPLSSASLRARPRPIFGPILERIPALFAALTTAVTPTFWSQATVAEVYTLNAAFVAAILLAVLIWGQTGSRRALYAAALLIGLSLAHHRTTLLYLPAILVYNSFQRSGQSGESASHFPGRLSLRTAAAIGLLVCLPLLLYLYLPLRAPHTAYNRMQVGPGQVLEFYSPTWRGFIEHVSGQGFGSALGAGKIAAARLAGLPALFIRELTLVGVALGLLGLAWLAWRRRPLLALTGLSWLVVVGFNLVYGIGDIYVYYIPAYLIWTLWMAAGVWACGNALVWLLEQRGRGTEAEGNRGAGEPRSREAERRENRGAETKTLGFLASLFPCFLAFLLPVYLLIAHFTTLDRSQDQTAQAWAALLAQPIQQNAILVTNDRDEMVPQWYLKYVEGRRTDLDGIFPLIQPGSAWADVGAVTEQALGSGRPVYLIKPMPGIEVKFALEHTAPAQVIGPAAANPPAQASTAIYGGSLRLAGYDAAPAALQPGGAAEITLYWQPVGQLGADYTTFVHLVDADGNKIAQSDHQPGGVYYPTSLWKPGETLVDRHTLALPTALGRPPYSIVVGLYDHSGELQHLGEPQTVGRWPDAP